MEITQLTQANAQIIADDWHYDGPYAFYDLGADPEDYQEMITPAQRGDHYYQMLTATGELYGYFVAEPTAEAGVVDVGLGMHPNITGQGHAQQFLAEIITFLRTHYEVKTLIFDVASFNIRAQKAYERAGFRVAREHEQATNGGHYLFIEMRRNFI